MSDSIQSHEEHQSEVQKQLIRRDVEEIDEYHDKYLIFELKDMIYGVDILGIKEIIEYDRVTKVPLAPSYIRGVINLRGNVVPIVDLAVRLGKEPLEVEKRTCIIILGIEQDGDVLDLGVVVDSVSEVIGIDEEAIEAAPSFGIDVRTDFVFGMGKINEKFVILLDVNKVLSIKELAEFYNNLTDDSDQKV